MFKLTIDSGYFIPAGLLAGFLLFLFYQYKVKIKDRRRLANLALFPEQNPNPVIEISFSGEITYMNPAAKKRFPDMKEKKLDHPLFQKIKSEIPRLHENDFKCEIELEDATYEQKVYTIQESKLWRIYSSDITVQKFNERRLANLALFPEQNPNPVIEARLDGTITYMNPAAMERFPDMKEKNLNHSLFDLIRPHIPEFQSNNIQKYNCEIVTGEYTFEQKVYAIPNENILRIYSSDITERKRNEALIRKKNKDITDSINYARRLQYAILPDDSLIRKTLPGSFILYKPKDIVSGDFYWYYKAHDSDLCFIAAVDCTGHGVPGAFMSLIGFSHLNFAVMEKELKDPSQILSLMDKRVCTALGQHSEDSNTKDGMEAALCMIDVKACRITFAGAMRPLYLVRNGIFEEIKGSKVSIGGFMDGKNFAAHTFQLNHGDTIYLTSDGYADQTGGLSGKKFMTRKLKELLTEISSFTPPEQKNILESRFEEWKGDNEQVDDVLLIGIKL